MIIGCGFLRLFCQFDGSLHPVLAWDMRLGIGLDTDLGSPFRHTPRHTLDRRRQAVWHGLSLHVRRLVRASRRNAEGGRVKHTGQILLPKVHLMLPGTARQLSGRESVTRESQNQGSRGYLGCDI